MRDERSVNPGTAVGQRQALSEAKWPARVAGPPLPVLRRPHPSLLFPQLGVSCHFSLAPPMCLFRKKPCRVSNKSEEKRGAWVAHLVKLPSLAQVMISLFVSSSPRIGLADVSSEPALDPLTPSLYLSPTCARSLSLSLSQK